MSLSSVAMHDRIAAWLACKLLARSRAAAVVSVSSRLEATSSLMMPVSSLSVAIEPANASTLSSVGATLTCASPLENQLSQCVPDDRVATRGTSEASAVLRWAASRGVLRRRSASGLRLEEDDATTPPRAGALVGGVGASLAGGVGIGRLSGAGFGLRFLLLDVARL